MPLSMAEARRWRRSAVYRRFRRALLDAEPLCRACAAAGRTREATELDHVVPLRARNLGGFWEVSNLQPLCRKCHAAKSALESEDARRRAHSASIRAITDAALKG